MVLRHAHAAVAVFLAWAKSSSALKPWLDGQWYDAPKDFNVAVALCKVKAKVKGGGDHYCTPPWQLFNGSCYYDSKQECEWEEAVEICMESMASSLPSIASAKENDFVQELCGQRMCWLGLRELRGLEDKWAWMDGTPITYWNWHAGEPSNFMGIDENVVIMNFGWKQYNNLEKEGAWADGDWFDVTGSFNKPSPICKRDLTQKNGKGFPYCAEGWDENEGSCYHLLDWNCTYAEAVEACAKENAHLVSINNEQEQMFVKATCGLRMCWLGLTQHKVSKTWSWSDGTPMDFANWGRGEPNNFGGHESVAMMNFDKTWARGKGGKWRSPVRKKLRQAFFAEDLGMEDYMTVRLRLGAMVLFVVCYLAAYIAQKLSGARVPGGPKTALFAVCVVIFLGGILDHLLLTHTFGVLGALLLVCAVEGMIIGGLAWKGHEENFLEARSPDFENNIHNLE